MIKAMFLSKKDEITTYGLTQWDYGQDLIIESEYQIPDGSEVSFYQNELEAVRYIKNKCVRIPDQMLQKAEEIKAYVYCITEQSGETILTIFLPVKPRKKPTNYIMKDEEEHNRLLPIGGEEGQALVKKSDRNYDTKWDDVANDLKLENNYLQLFFNSKPIGTRIRLPTGGNGNGREIELKNDGIAIKWRYTDSNEWKTLIELEELKGNSGKDGITPEFEIRSGHLIVKYKEEKGDIYVKGN